MSNELKYSVGVDTSGAEQGLENVKTKVEALGSSNDKLGQKQQTLAGALRSTTRQLQQMEYQFSQLSDADKNSQFGKNLKAQIDALYQKAGSLADLKADIQQNIKNIASDTANWDAMKQSIEVTTSAITAFASATGIAKEDGSLMAETLNTIARVQAMANAAITIGNALQKQSALMVGIRAMQSKLLTTSTIAETGATNANTTATTANTVATGASTTAKNAETVATGKATVAQKLFNTVAKANPYVILAAAVIAVGGALLAYAKYSSDATAKEKAHEEELKKTKEAWDSYKQSVASSGAPLLNTYSKLQESWKQLKSISEKNQWIKDNKKEFDSLGISIDSVADAENVLVTNTESVVQAFMLRAKAAALAAQNEKLWGEYLEQNEELQKQHVNAGDTVKGQTSFSKDSSGGTYNNGNYMMGNDGKYHYTQKGADEKNTEIDSKLSPIMEKIESNTRQTVDITKQSNNLLKSKGVNTNTSSNSTTPKKTTSTTTTKVETVADKGSLADVENEISKLQKKIKETNWDTDTQGLKDAKSKLVELIDTRDILKETVEVDIKVVGFAKAKSDLKSAFEEAKKAQEKVYVKSVSASDVFKTKDNNFGIDNGNSKQLEANNIQIEVNNSGIDEATTEIQTLQEAYDKLYDSINAASGQGIDTSSQQEELESLGGQIDGLIEKRNTMVAQNSELVDTNDELAEKLKQQQKTIKALGNASSAISTLGSAFSQLGSSFDNDALNVAGIIAEAIANVLSGYAAASAQAASMGPWAWAAFSIAGLAQVAAVIAQINNLSKHAGGGIVPGSSTIGDMNLIRANAGEMVLNNTQQARLFRALNTGNGLGGDVVSGGSSTVTFEIEGDTLVGAISNNRKIKSKLLGN